MMRAVPLRRTAYSARRAGPRRCGAKRACCALQFQAACGLFIFCCSTAQRKVTTTNMPLPPAEGSSRAAPQLQAARVAAPMRFSQSRTRHRAPEQDAKEPLPSGSAPFPPSSRAFRFSGIPLFSYRNITASVPRSSKKSVPPLIAGQKKTPLAGRVLCVRAGRHIRRCGAKGTGGKYFPPAEPGAGPEVPTCDRSSPGWCGASARRERIRRR